MGSSGSRARRATPIATQELSYISEYDFTESPCLSPPSRCREEDELALMVVEDATVSVIKEILSLLDLQLLVSSNGKKAYEIRENILKNKGYLTGSEWKTDKSKKVCLLKSMREGIELVLRDVSSKQRKTWLDKKEFIEEEEAKETAATLEVTRRESTLKGSKDSRRASDEDVGRRLLTASTDPDANKRANESSSHSMMKPYQAMTIICLLVSFFQM